MKSLRTIWHILRVPAALIGVLAVATCGDRGPPLLQHVTAASGWVGACPPENDMEAKGQAKGLALSPELNSWLKQQFPPGSREDGLVRTLVAQKFWSFTTCEHRQSIRISTFNGYAGGIFNTWAAVYWEVDDARNIVWTKGFVAFDGL